MAQSPAAELISIIIPCHNEATNIASLHRELTAVVDPLPEQFEFLFVDDGSRDGTPSCVREVAAGDPRVRLIELARNFGKEVATTAGLHRAEGAAAITIDADLQHPTALIPELIAKWRDGHEVVIGVRRIDRGYASIVKRLGSKAFYRIMNAISEVEIMPRSTDYRLLDRSVIEAFVNFTERNRITRGLIDWLGFRRAYIEFTPAKRASGQSAYSFRKLFQLATNSFVSMSLLPLKIAGYLGLIIMFTAGPLGLFIFWSKYVAGDPFQMQFSGTATLAVIIMFLVGLILASQGLMALYIANIHTEVMNRPLYVIRPESLPRATPALPPVVQAPPLGTEAKLPHHRKTRRAQSHARATTREQLREQPTFGEVRGG